MTQKTELGQTGENLACDYLTGKGYKIIERNFRKPWGELDVVALTPDKILVFVEVKTMKSFGSAQGLRLFNEAQSLRPEDQMTAAKLKKFKKAAKLYAGHNQNLINDKKGWRLDVIAITKTDSAFSHSGSETLQGRTTLNHYENV